MEGPVICPDASPQTGSPWQYWRGSQAQLTADQCLWIKGSHMAPGNWLSCGGRTLNDPVIMNICEGVHEKFLSLFSHAQLPAPKPVLLYVAGCTPKHCLAEMEKWS